MTDSPTSTSAPALNQKPDSRSRLLFMLAALLFLAWVAFLAVLAVISGKRPESRPKKDGARSASRSIGDRWPNSGRPQTTQIGHSPAPEPTASA